EPALAITDGWKRLGLSIPLQGIERTAFSDRLKSQAFTVARASWYGDYPDPTTFLVKFRSNDGNNDGRYANPASDARLDQAQVELDPARRMALLAEAEAILLEDAGLIPLYHYTNLELFDPARVKNLHPNPWNYRRLDAVEVRDQGSGGGDR